MLSYLERGNGNHWVVLLHGFLGMGRNLASLARRWSDQDPSMRFILPDLPGHGTSPPLPPNATLESVAQSVVDFCKTLAPDDIVDLVGHSLGGRIALLVRDLCAESFNTVTLLDVGPGPMPKLLDNLDTVIDALVAAPARAESRGVYQAFFLERRIDEKRVNWLLTNLQADPRGGVSWRIERQALYEFGHRTRMNDLWPLLPKTTKKTHCIRGDRSPFVSDDEAQRLLAQGVSVHTLKGSGHQVHADALEELLRVLQDLHKK